MRKLLLSAALCAVMASCSASPVMAQAECNPLAPLLIGAGVAKANGASVSVFSGRQAVLGLEAIGALAGPPPRAIEITTLLIVSMGDKAAIVLGEGDKACFTLPVSSKNARIVELAITGEPA